MMLDRMKVRTYCSIYHQINPEPDIARQKPYLGIPTTASARFVFFLKPKNILRFITYKQFFVAPLHGDKFPDNCLWYTMV